MADETTSKTAIEFLVNRTNHKPIWSGEECMNAYARQVAQQVRQQCAEEAQIDGGDLSGFWVDRESILSVDIEQFIK